MSDTRVTDLDEMIESLDSINPALDGRSVNMALFMDYYSQLEAVLCNNSDCIAGWLKELREYRNSQIEK